jgi:hypothetical protein
MAAAVQRSAIEASRQRLTLRQTRRTEPMMFSMMLVQASESPVNNAEALYILGSFVRHQYSRLQGDAAARAETLQNGLTVEGGRAA